MAFKNRFKIDPMSRPDGPIQNVYVVNWPDGGFGGGGGGKGGGGGGGVAGGAGISKMQGWAKIFDELGPSIGRFAYQASRAARYMDTLNNYSGSDSKDAGKKAGGGKDGKGSSSFAGGAGGVQNVFVTNWPGQSFTVRGKPVKPKDAGKEAGAEAGAEEAAAMAGSGAKLAKLAGPIGAALALADMAAGVSADILNGVTKKIEQFGDAAVKVAGNDGIGAVVGVGESVVAGLEEIPIVGQLFASRLRIAVAGLVVFNQALNAFASRGKELASYSAGIAGAKANSDVSLLLADMREGQALDKEYAQMIQAQTRLQVSISDALIPFKRELMKILIPLTNQIAMGIEKYSVYAEEAAVALARFAGRVDEMLQLLSPGYATLRRMGKNLESIDKNTKKDDDTKMAFHRLFDMAGKVKIDTPAADPAADAAAAQISFPLFANK